MGNGQENIALLLESTLSVPQPLKIRKRYTEYALQKSINAVKTKAMSLGQASQCFGVPKSTIKFRLGTKWTKKLRRGPQTVLSLQEETKIVQLVQEMERRGFPCTKHALISRVKAFLDKNPRQTPFKDNRPGNKWLKLLLGRHKQLSIRKPENVTMAGATVAEADIRGWFEKIKKYLGDNNLNDVFLDPRRILNGDETMFLLDPVTKSVVASKGNCNVYLVQQADSKKNVTVLFTFDADGYMFPPDAILPYKRLSKQLLVSFDPEWGIGKSDRGWMDSENFVAYIQNILHPSLVRRNVTFPVIYFVDGHSSHTGYDAAEICADLGIILIALYPNATHIMQPADVAIFKPLKNSWSKCVDEWKMRNDGRMFTIEDFGGVLKEAISRGVSQSTVRAGFRKCGLFPYDANAVDYSRCLATSNYSPHVPITRPPTENETVPVELSKIKQALRMVSTTKIKSMVDMPEAEISNNSEKALLYIYKSILLDYAVDDDTMGNDHENLSSIDVTNSTFGNDETSNCTASCAPQTSTDYVGEQVENLPVNQMYEILEYSPTTDDLSVEIIDNESTYEVSGITYDVEPIHLNAFTSEQDNHLNDMVVISAASSNSSEPETNERVVLEEIVNNEKDERRNSISSFFKIPATPKRKNVKRNYTSKRHFVLTSRERLKELEDKDNEKQRLALQKELKKKDRATKKEIKEKEKQERMKMREQKKMEQELNLRLKQEAGKPSRKLPRTLKAVPPKKVRNRSKFADENENRR
ncbi:uncharacterized protein LOC131681009 [Topomyia yanbarensis]|uniref:uncharacterized protein LOC131681009 n=1 Tax=Topomyia yanbarensis TaxID=2498891 RepID=UPI00273B7B24|nr:uncharacterized protein LOC131681009 [Topomyia yanbarensis]